MSALPSPKRAYLIVSEVCTLFRRNEATLRRWRRLGIGPPYVKTESGTILYPRAEVERYLAERTRSAK